MDSMYDDLNEYLADCEAEPVVVNLLSGLWLNANTGEFFSDWEFAPAAQEPLDDEIPF